MGIFTLQLRHQFGESSQFAVICDAGVDRARRHSYRARPALSIAQPGLSVKESCRSATQRGGRVLVLQSTVDMIVESFLLEPGTYLPTLLLNPKAPPPIRREEGLLALAHLACPESSALFRINSIKGTGLLPPTGSLSSHPGLLQQPWRTREC